jgi:hypothetical protein
MFSTTRLAEAAGTRSGCTGATAAVSAGAVDAVAGGDDVFPVDAQPVTSAKASIAKLVVIFIVFP